MIEDVRIRPDAVRDIEDSARWYESQRQGLGREFLDALEQALDQVCENPSFFPVVHKHVRRALLPRFPFGVHYLISGNHIVVLAVMHGSRDPACWKNRR